MRRKTITITEEQDDWVDDNHINLSGLVRELLSDKIAEARKK